MVTRTNETEDWLIDDTGEAEKESTGNLTSPWTILIVDDEPDVHPMTRLALRDMQYRGRPLEILSAYSAAEGFQILKDHPETALVLLDVVMETDDAGLNLVRRIRNELSNTLIRIILRTGQPGQAPEERLSATTTLTTTRLKRN